MAYDEALWTEMDNQGRRIKWLAKTTGISLQRLYDLRHRGGWWRHHEAKAVSQALGQPTNRLFPPGSLVLPPGRRYPSIRGLIVPAPTETTNDPPTTHTDTPRPPADKPPRAPRPSGTAGAGHRPHPPAIAQMTIQSTRRGTCAQDIPGAAGRTEQ